ncbi:MAG TPA: NADP-dependent oxidoreductase [Amnibacterium sp.]|jgi:NADPH:quinone reductase-like Zn-dependent oxidoreductase|uniref:NADP-dependent oxidoreductase n=1 Tax=Amnibacterium sp. TaxID=1872496 RepID=UPI002F938CEB
MTNDIPTTARRVLAPEYGGPDVLRLVDEEVVQPGPGQVMIAVRAAGVNPADYKGFSGQRSSDPAALPIKPGYEVAGVVVALGADTELASGGGAVGDEVVAFRVAGGYASVVTVPAKDVFAKPAPLDFPAAANLLLVAATAADMLRVVDVEEGQTILVHGASGAVGVSVLQLARERGIRAVGTASERNFQTVRRFGGEPIAYGAGLQQRAADAAPEGYAAALDCVGTDEAVDVSLALVSKDRLVTIAAFGRAQAEGFEVVGGGMPESAAFRDRARPELLALAAEGRLEVPVARTYPLEKAAEALTFLSEGHPGGKLALIP